MSPFLFPFSSSSSLSLSFFTLFSLCLSLPSLFPLQLSLSLSLSLQVHNKYTAHDFDDDLCTVLGRAGCHDEKVVFIMNESNVLDSAFLERLKTLLANGEVSREGGREGRGGAKPVKPVSTF